VLATRHAHSSGVPDLTGRVAALDRALASGAPQLDPDAVSRARAVLSHVGDRSRLGAQTTVVALVGATGSGKSSLFNAISGLDISDVGVTRPTTGRPMACIWGREVADPVLDYVDVPRRHRMERESVLDGDREVPLHGLVLLDVPDHDSTAVEHRIEVDRLVQIVDLMIWVVDPQKYADEALHARYLQRLTGHDEVMLVVLNQVDRLSEDEIEICRRDLRRLLDADGLASVRLLTASATRGDGVQKLRSILGEVVHKQAAVPQRLAADLDEVNSRLAAGIGSGEADLSKVVASGELVAALSDAAGVGIVLDAASAEYRRNGRRATGWPPARWLGKLRRDPVKRLKLGADEAGVKQLVRGARPATTPAQLAGVSAAVEKVTGAASAGLPRRWADAVRASVTVSSDTEGAGLGVALDQALLSVDVGKPKRGWFHLVRLLQWLALLALVGGLGWLAAEYVADRFDLGTLENPSVGELPSGEQVPLAAVIAAGGALVGLVLTLLARWWVRVGARRRRARAQEQLSQAIEALAQQRVVAPVGAVLTAHRQTREALTGQG
jgi:GTPase Era involved in 16S rRNA processing